MNRRLPFLSLLLSLLIDHVEAGVCEELDIPMETVDLGVSGSVCKVRECETVTENDRGIDECIKCDQSGQAPGEGKGAPRTESCPLELGKCESGRCVPRTESTFYEKWFGRKWQGLNTWNLVTVTHYGGDVACGGFGDATDVDQIVPCLNRVGIDGMAAVPAQMYGSAATKGQACYKNNNLCYKLTGPLNATAIVAVFDRCGGYIQCLPPDRSAVLDMKTVFAFPPHDDIQDGVVWADANACVYQKGAQFLSGLGQMCQYSDGTEAQEKATCCQGNCGQVVDGKGEQIDWCASQSHPHFDIDRATLTRVCDNGGSGGINKGSCALRHVEPIKCPLHPKQGKCCASGGSCTASTCTIASGNGNDGESECAAMGGTWCAGDSWVNICDATDIPTFPPNWTPLPTDWPAPGAPWPGQTGGTVGTDVVATEGQGGTPSGGGGSSSSIVVTTTPSPGGTPGGSSDNTASPADTPSGGASTSSAADTMLTYVVPPFMFVPIILRLL